jgi:hypothetical protein
MKIIAAPPGSLQARRLLRFEARLQYRRRNFLLLKVFVGVLAAVLAIWIIAFLYLN